MSKFTKVRKWALQNNIAVSDIEDGVRVFMNGGQIDFTNERSTIYRSGRTGTLKGTPKGIYYSTNGRAKLSLYDQNHAIEILRDYHRGGM